MAVELQGISLSILYTLFRLNEIKVEHVYYLLVKIVYTTIIPLLFIRFAIRINWVKRVILATF